MLEWMNDAACAGMELNLFFDDYLEHADKVDSICMACPVIKQCYRSGITLHSYGVWGGFFLFDGYISRTYNQHKTQQVWDDLLTILTTDGA